MKDVTDRFQDQIDFDSDHREALGRAVYQAFTIDEDGPSMDKEAVIDFLEALFWELVIEHVPYQARSLVTQPDYAELADMYCDDYFQHVTRNY